MVHLEQTITVINNSGKIISTGKQLANIFKGARAAYQEKKATLKSDRLRSRAATFDVPRSSPGFYDEYGAGQIIYEEPYHDDERYTNYHPHHREPQYIEDYGEDDGTHYGHGQRRYSVDDAASRVSSRRSVQSRRSNTDPKPRRARTMLTETNLRSHSEVSSTTPSQHPGRSIYRGMPPAEIAETVRDDQGRTYIGSPRPQHHGVIDAVTRRPRSDPDLRDRPKSVDMHLAYGNIPPDLASRVDLDHQNHNDHLDDNDPEAVHEAEAKTLMGRIETLLDEAHCLHHSATAIMTHLQASPDAAAAVALTLAELSALLGKMSPGFLSVVKGGSPAIFALLASPQFLIGTSIAVGVTVVMFGGWKIVKRIKEAQAAKQLASAYEMNPMMACNAQFGGGGGGGDYDAGVGGFDEALILGDELSSIESWRRGIVPFGEDDSVDMELISPEAMRSRKGMNKGRGGDDDDARTVRTHRTSKTAKTSKSSKSAQTSGKDKDKDKDKDRSKDHRGSRHGDDAASEAGSHRSHRSSRSSSSKHGGSGSSSKIQVKAIEDGKRHGKKDDLAVVVRSREKKSSSSSSNSMLKSIFKKKREGQGEDRDGGRRVSVMV